MGVFSWMALGALLLHIIPFFRLVTRPVRALLKNRPEWEFPFARWMILSGHWEYLLGPLRDRFLSLALLIWVVLRWILETPITQDTLLGSSLIVFFNLLAIINIRYRDSMGLKLGELGRLHSNMHPEDFFHLYYVLLCPWPPPFPQEGFRGVSYHEADYRTGSAPIQTLRPTLEAALSTSTLARLVMIAFQRVGPEHGCNVFDGLARLWGSRIAQLFHLRLSTRLPQVLEPLEGKTLLVFNHQSVLDFALNFFALGDIRVHSQERLGLNTRHLRPRFIAAKDHFVDNPFLYSWLGLGKVIENVGMVLINRKQKGKGWQAMAEAAEKLSQSDVEIAVYPQGTRAHPLKSFSGKRRDAGFYTTCSAKHWQDPLGHLKPGTAHLIVDSLIKLYEKGEPQLNILVVGIVGAGIAGPKGAWRVQTETEIEYRVSPTWTLSTQEAQGLQIPKNKEPANEAEERYLKRVEEIQWELSTRLAQTMDWHAQLMEVLEAELPHLDLGEAEQENLLHRLHEAQAQNHIKSFILLDRILSLPTDQWLRFFQLWLALPDKVKDMAGEDKALMALLQEVTEKLIKKK